MPSANSSKCFVGSPTTGGHAKIFLAAIIVVFVCTARSAGSQSTVADAGICGQSELMSTIVGSSRFDPDDSKSETTERPQANVEAIAATAVDIYELAAEEHAMLNADQIATMDRALQNAESDIILVASFKHNHAMQLRKLWADLLDRLIWGGSFLIAGYGLSLLARRFRRWARPLRCVTMVLFGCAYAILLPILALVVIGAWALGRCNWNIRPKDPHDTTCGALPVGQ